MTTPAVAVIIPSLDGDVGPIRAALARQTLPPSEVAVVAGVRPNGRARNIGVAQTSAPLLLFLDDDALPGDATLIARLIAPLLADATIGVTGAAKILPPGAPWFQRWAAREVARVVHPVVARDSETNPDPPDFYCDVTTTCCAMRRELFERAGGFDERLVRGVDTEFFVRVRRTRGEDGAAPRFVLVANTWTYHPAPATFGALLRKQFLYGFGHAQEVRRDGTRARGRALTTPLHAAAFLALRTAIVLPNIFVPYSYAAPSWRLGFKPLKAVASYASALGYVWGWYRGE